MRGREKGEREGDILKGEPKYATTFLRYTISPATYFHHFLHILVTVKAAFLPYIMHTDCEGRERPAMR